MRRRVAHQIEPDRRVPGFRRRRPHRADANVVDARSLADLRLAVRREPDQALLPDDRPRGRHRNIVLSEVDTVRLDLGRKQRIVVDDEERPRLAAARSERERIGAQPRSRALLVAHLHHVHAARERVVEHTLERDAVADQVQAGPGKAFAAGHRTKVCQHGNRWIGTM